MAPQLMARKKSGLTLAELRSGSFVKILKDRTRWSVGPAFWPVLMWVP
jgi:hypothetical protein